MLILTRKIGEKIVVPSCGLVLTVISMRGKRVRLGINAPPSLRVDREEVWNRCEDSAQTKIASTSR